MILPIQVPEEKPTFQQRRLREGPRRQQHEEHWERVDKILAQLELDWADIDHTEWSMWMTCDAAELWGWF